MKIFALFLSRPIALLFGFFGPFAWLIMPLIAHFCYWLIYKQGIFGDSIGDDSGSSWDYKAAIFFLYAGGIMSFAFQMFNCEAGSLSYMCRAIGYK